MSRHRRQASQVLPPELLTGDESLGDLLGQATARVQGITAINEKSTNPSITQHHQEQSTTATATGTASHFPAKKPPPAGKPA
ncbi:hypothetical protein JCGZ_22787 [Jatropha curcas]|uniref:Uncharacterized protein n=1 Tax=Jatropha curcas TaxID=180498 RepID=A0A067LFI0_JATCU|nr:hypothetical protein JCGZ_22787 [Jatropha curcas]